MEMVFNTDEGIITSSEEFIIKIGIDDILYYPVDCDDIADIKLIHFIDLQYGFIYINKQKNQIKIIIPNNNDDIDDIVFNKNRLIDLDKLKTFICYFNYYKSSYFYNIQCYALLNKAKKSFNTKELYLNMNLYVTKKYFNEIATKMNSYKPLYLSFLTVTENKCKNNNLMKNLFFEKDSNIDNNVELKVVMELKNLFENIYDKLIDKEEIKDNSKNSNWNSNSIYTCNEYQLENIDKIKGYYINLIKILNELKRSFYERIVSNKYDIHDINNIERNELKNKLDICTRFYYIKFKNLEFTEFKSMNKPLISKNQELKKENEKLISQLKAYIEKNNIQIYLCFRCGNLLFKLKEKQKSTCNYDNNCFNISNFYCKLCHIYFCSYCLHYPKNFKCMKNHEIKLLIKYDKLDNNLIKEKYQCELCGRSEIKNNISLCGKCKDSFVCIKCKEENEKNFLTSYKCKCGQYLFWRRGLYTICNKCNIFNNCFWICFFCKKSFCVNCFKTFRYKCGLMHELNEVCLDDNININKIKVKDLFNNKILIRFNCDVCKNRFFSRFYYCSRCNFIKCYKCNK